MNSRTAIITGGSRGLGRNTAMSLARRGVDVIVTYHARKQDAETVIREIEAMGRKAAAFQLDTGDARAFDGFASAVRKTLQTWGREKFDFLVNNAGYSLHVPFADVTEAQFDEMVNVGFKGVYFLTQKLLPLMNDGGRIVNLSSGLARVAMGNSSAYGAVKGAIEVLTRYLAKELAPRKITANVVAPGPIQTDFSRGMVRDNAAVNKTISEMTALGRPGVFGRYRSHDRGPAVRREPLGERATDRGLRRVRALTARQPEPHQSTPTHMQV